MTRIIAGLAKGRRLAVPPAGTRPTSDRAREGLFSSLGSLLGRTSGGPDALTGLRFLDLYAGSGAVGLEALSRGAAAVSLVEQDRSAAATVSANLAAVGLPGAVVERVPVERFLAVAPTGPGFDAVFADPPYDLPDDAVNAVLTALVAHGWLTAEAVVVVERATRSGWAWPAGWVAERHRRYGEATLWYGRAAG